MPQSKMMTRWLDVSSTKSRLLPGSYMTPSLIGTKFIDLNGFVVPSIDQGNCVFAVT
jgi:hypothetical protein